MKSILSNLILIGFTASLFVSCGDKSSTASSTFSSAGISTSSDINTIVTSLGTQNPCTTGTRLPAVSCQIQLMSGSSNTVGSSSEVSCTTGGPSGVSKIYIGSNNYRDLMIISQTTGGQYYASLAMCPFGTSLTSNRAITSLRSYSGAFNITVGDIVSNNTGSIIAAKDLYVKISAYGDYSETYFGPSTFYPVNIQ